MNEREFLLSTILSHCYCTVKKLRVATFSVSNNQRYFNILSPRNVRPIVWICFMCWICYTPFECSFASLLAIEAFI
jgi:hypothetical protein